MSLLSSNVSGSTKSKFLQTLVYECSAALIGTSFAETTVSSLFFVFYAVGNLVGPQTFRAQDAPRYGPGLATSVAVIAFGIADLAVIWFLYARENRRRDRIMSSPDYGPKTNQEFLDLTDRENIAFRYSC